MGNVYVGGDGGLTGWAPSFASSFVFFLFFEILVCAPTIFATCV